MFSDRLVDASDLEQFFQIVGETLSQQFKVSADKLLGHLASGQHVTGDDVRGLFFGDYMVPGADPRIYDEVQNLEELTTTIEK